MIEQSLTTLIENADALATMDDAQFANFCRLWHAANDAVKDAIYAQDFNSRRFSREDFERDWGAQSTLFMADILPFIHQKLLRHYRRRDVLRAIDVGAASCFGTRLLATLHNGHFIYSRMEIDAIDHIPDRARWVRAVVRDVNYEVSDLYALPARSWDIVVCSHVIEHVPEPAAFIARLRDICKGFAFVYSPYAEDPLMPGHVNKITEADYAPYPCETHVIKSMGRHPDKPADMCILAVIDCREEPALNPADGRP